MQTVHKGKTRAGCKRSVSALCFILKEFSHFNTVYYNLLAWHSRLLEQVGTHLCYLFVLAHSKYLEAHPPGSHLIIAFCRVWLNPANLKPALCCWLAIHHLRAACCYTASRSIMFQSMSTRLPPGVWQQLNRADVHCDGSVSCWKLGANVFLHS